MHQIGEVLHGRYKVVQPIAEGGMGRVYLVEDIVKKGARCALKEYDYFLDAGPGETAVDVEVTRYRAAPDDLAQYQSSFTTEASILASLNHKNLPALENFFADADKYVLVTPFIEGTDLETLIQRAAGGRFSLRQVTRWARELLDVVEYCHRKNVLHLDIKPANVMIDRKGRLYLIDFGIAHLNSAVNQKRRLLAGTRGFRAPEQVTPGAAIDWSADQYGIAATLYFLLTGLDPVDALDRQNGAVLPPAKSLRPDLPPNWDAAIARSLSLEPAGRFAALGQFAAALQLTNQPQAWVKNGMHAVQQQLRPFLKNYLPVVEENDGRPRCNPRLCVDGQEAVYLVWPDGRVRVYPEGIKTRPDQYLACQLEWENHQPVLVLDACASGVHQDGKAEGITILYKSGQGRASTRKTIYLDSSLKAQTDPSVAAGKPQLFALDHQSMYFAGQMSKGRSKADSDQPEIYDDRLRTCQFNHLTEVHGIVMLNQNLFVAGKKAIYQKTSFVLWQYPVKTCEVIERYIGTAPIKPFVFPEENNIWIAISDSRHTANDALLALDLKEAQPDCSTWSCISPRFYGTTTGQFAGGKTALYYLSRDEQDRLCVGWIGRRRMRWTHVEWKTEEGTRG